MAKTVTPDTVLNPHAIRISNDDWELIRSAAQIERTDASSFVRRAAVRAAEKVLKKSAPAYGKRSTSK